MGHVTAIAAACVYRMMAVKYLHDHPIVLEELRKENMAIREKKKPEDPFDYNNYRAMRFKRVMQGQYSSHLDSLISEISCPHAIKAFLYKNKLTLLLKYTGGILRKHICWYIGTSSNLSGMKASGRWSHTMPWSSLL
ncbi:hypothetical protein RND71_026293 [Anisodus tanguticus]|uniref:Uncharacterized protein n=1 Tax=Anisodus tanguticus TaxID=243964 RepID=A0AAE1VAD1_9SOLA|nr:hypothetical protein RND71_026293 [Anisodus tanguticus]